MNVFWKIAPLGFALISVLWKFHHNSLLLHMTENPLTRDKGCFFFKFSFRYINFSSKIFHCFITASIYLSSSNFFFFFKCLVSPSPASPNISSIICSLFFYSLAVFTEVNLPESCFYSMCCRDLSIIL